jgi:hypothetical protein
LEEAVDLSYDRLLMNELNLKNQNGTHHAVFAYNKFQMLLSGVKE